jgi:hypothetical protein
MKKTFYSSNIHLFAGVAVLLFVGAVYLKDSGKIVSGLKPVSSDPASQIADTVFSSCSPQNRKSGLSKETCYSKEFIKVSQEQGPVIAFAALASLQQKDNDAIGCHLIAHGIGTGAYKRDPKNWRTLIRTVNSSCSYGAIHGILENYVSTLPGGHLPKEMIPTICGEKPRADCNHSIGHLLLVEAGGDIKKGLELCQVFEYDKVQQFHCQTGIFMEYQTALNLVAHGLASQDWLNWPARVNDLEKICRSYSGTDAVACWKEITHAALSKFNYDPKTIFDFCSSAQVVDGAKECRRHAIGIMSANVRFDLNKLKYMCALPQKSDPTFESDCYVQMAASDLSTIPGDTEKVRTFCLSLEQQFQSACLAQVGYKQPKLND